MKNYIVAIAAILMMSACSTVTIRDQGTQKLGSEPNWSQSESFFFWGLAGESHIDVANVCGGKNPTQLQTQRTFGDGVLTFITLGIYSPRSARIWCE